jgi:hypothetical protein
MAIFEKEQQIK